MKLVIDESRCKGCNLCVLVCPYKIFRGGKELNSRGIVTPVLRRTRTVHELQVAGPLRTDVAASAT